MPRILFVVTELGYFLSHRAAFAAYLQTEGFEVAVATRFEEANDQDAIKRLQQQNIQVFNLPYWHRSRLSPLDDARTLWQLGCIFLKYQPTIIQTVALKPIVYTSVIAQLWQWLYQLQVLNVTPPAMVHLFAGLGFLFTDSPAPTQRSPWMRRVVSRILSYSLRQPRVTAVVQNQDDAQTLRNITGIDETKCQLIPGSGIDVEQFTPTPLPSQPPLIATFIGRLLWDKGVGELAAAGKILKDRKAKVKLRVYGVFDAANPSAIDEEALKKWHDLGFIEWMGPCHDVAAAYAQSHVAVLLSYREGLPKSLLEAAACARAIITADVPGCRAVVRPGDTGALIPAGDPQALAELLIQWQKDPKSWATFGTNARTFVDDTFSDTIVYKKFADLYQTV